MKPANASAMRSTSDQVSVHRHIRSPDELTLPLRPSQSQMSWRLSDSACHPDVKWRCRAVRTTSAFAVAVPHAAAATSASHSDGTFRLERFHPDWNRSHAKML